MRKTNFFIIWSLGIYLTFFAIIGCDSIRKATSGPTVAQPFVGLCDDWESERGSVEFCFQSASARWVTAEMDEAMRQALVIADEKFTRREMEALTIEGGRLFIEDSAYTLGGEYKRNPPSAHIIDSGDLFAFLVWLWRL